MKRIWLLTTGEPLPSDGEDIRLLRTGLFFEDLVGRGIQVDWWTSGFDHANRRHRTHRQVTKEVDGTGRIILLPSPGYGRSVSAARLKDHRAFADQFLRTAHHFEAPSIIYCAYPTIALSRVATVFGRERGIPVVLDIRDLWPDVIWDTLFGARLRWLRAGVLNVARPVAARAIKDAAAVVGLTEEYVEWALSLGSRARGPLDRAIPVTYPPHVPLTSEEVRGAEAFWRDRGLDPDAHWIACFLGTIGRQFDFRPVLEAARRLAETHPQIRFVLCGEGDGIERLRADSSHLQNVLLPGWIDGPPRRLLLERAKVGLAPYAPTENFLRNLPNKPVEYFAHGLPVLYGIEGVIHRICTREGCGHQYSTSSTRAASGDLASILSRLWSEPKTLEVLSRNARGRFEAHHHPDRVTDLLLDHAQAVIDQEVAP